MNDVEIRFKACIESLERFYSDYIQPNKSVLELRSPIQLQPSTQNASLVVSGSSTAFTPIVINDYVRMCHAYCIMLWTYWEALGAFSGNLEELKLIRNCLVHHEGDMAKYSQDPVKKFSQGGVRLISLTQGKSYTQGYNLVITEADLLTFTSLVKGEAVSLTRVTF